MLLGFLLFFVAFGALLSVVAVTSWWREPLTKAASGDNRNPFNPFYGAHKPLREAEVMNPSPFTSFGDVFTYYFVGDFAWSQTEVAIFFTVVSFTLLASAKVLVDMMRC